MKPLVLYHGGCADGLTAAWVAWRALTDMGRTPECRPVQYGDPVPEDVGGREVYVLDFAWKRDEMLALRAASQSLMVLDHHKTHEKELEGLPFCWFSQDESGARMAWREFIVNRNHPWGAPGAWASPFWLACYVEDRDLWRWRLERSKEVNACIQSWPKSLNDWDALAFLGRDKAIDQGVAILRYQATLLDQICQKPREVRFDGFKGLAVNSPVLQSEVGERLSEGQDFGACWFDLADGTEVWSLRSREPSMCDVSEICRRRGGGGHTRAAGFRESPNRIVEPTVKVG